MEAIKKYLWLVVDNSADAPAAGVDVMHRVSHASEMERLYTQIQIGMEMLTLFQ